MDYTYLDYFNYYLKEYINELINTFPETQEPLLSNYRNLLEGRDDKNDLYAKCFYTKINNYLAHIAKRDVSLFETPGKVFIEGVDLVNVWHNTNATEQSHIAIWKYLQILMILGRKIIPNHKEIVELLQKVSNGDVSIPAKVEKTLSNVEKDETEEPSGVFGLGDIASSLGGLGSIANSLGLGKLADGLGLGGKGSGKGGDGDGGGLGGLGGIGSLVSSITDMFKNPEFTNAMSQLSQTMSSASTPAPATENNTDAQTPEATSSTNSNTDLQDLSTLDNAPSQQSPEQQNPQMPQLFNNPLFGDLAKELSDTFNFADMEKEGKPQNIGDAMSKFMTGNNPAKLMGLVGKFGSKLQQEVQKGSINPAELLKQTMGAMGGMGGMGGGKDKGTSEGDTMQQTMATMMQQMTQNPQMAQMAQNIAKSMTQQQPTQQATQQAPQQATKAHRNKK